MTSVAQRARDALHTEEWVDDVVLYHLLQDVLAHSFQSKSTGGIVVIDPLNVALFIDSVSLSKRKPITDPTLIQCRSQFRDACKRDALLLLPLHCDNHWSLMAYRPSFRQWYCCDSMGNYHRQRVLGCLDALDRLKLLSAEESTRVYFYDNLPRQPLSYECARYVLFYAFVMIKAATDASVSSDGVAYAARLEQDLPHVCEHNRAAFEAHLLKLLDRREEQ